MTTKLTGMHVHLQEITLKLRISLIKISSSCKIPHLGSCLSCLEILVYLYWAEMKIDPYNPNDLSRDKFILSKGHASPALMQILAFKGFFSVEKLSEFGRDGSYFHEHPPKPGVIPGIEAATGSLGHGLPMGIGMAIAQKILNKHGRIYILIGDGECNEGVIWEAAMLASSQRLGNVTVVIDFNKWQATGRSLEVMALDPLAKKWASFGWHTQEINGHDFIAIDRALAEAKSQEERPSVIVAHTVKGKGVSFMEDNNNWHYRTPNSQELDAALSELESAK